MVEKSNTSKPDLNQILGTPIANGKMAAAMTFD
jgi:zinc transporter 2